VGCESRQEEFKCVAIMNERKQSCCSTHAAGRHRADRFSTTPKYATDTHVSPTHAPNCCRFVRSSPFPLTNSTSARCRARRASRPPLHVMPVSAARKWACVHAWDATLRPTSAPRCPLCVEGNDKIATWQPTPYHFVD
jgi:hypothetical protein